MAGPREIVVRDALPADLREIAEFNCLLAAETENRRLDPATALRGATRVMDRPALGRYYVATIGGQLAGQTMITYEWSDWRDGAFWWIQSVYVPPAYRRRGVCRAMIEHVRRAAQDSPGVCGLRLYVEQHNQAALATYGRLGLTPSGYVVYEQDWSAGE